MRLKLQNSNYSNSNYKYQNETLVKLQVPMDKGFTIKYCQSLFCCRFIPAFVECTTAYRLHMGLERRLMAISSPTFCSYSLTFFKYFFSFTSTSTPIFSLSSITTTTTTTTLFLSLLQNLEIPMCPLKGLYQTHVQVLDWYDSLTHFLFLFLHVPNMCLGQPMFG